MSRFLFFKINKYYLLFCVFFLKFFDTSFRVYDLLFSGKERMTLRTDVNAYFGLC